jgi:hypothetical protein
MSHKGLAVRRKGNCINGTGWLYDRGGLGSLYVPRNHRAARIPEGDLSPVGRDGKGRTKGTLVVEKQLFCTALSIPTTEW